MYILHTHTYTHTTHTHSLKTQIIFKMRRELMSLEQCHIVMSCKILYLAYSCDVIILFE